MERTGRWLFGIPWIGVGCQHFIYADFVSNIVPAYMPWRIGWVYITAICMMAAGIAVLSGKWMTQAARMLALMMGLFLIMVHPTLLIPEPGAIMHWTRFLQDISITGVALILGGLGRRGGRLVYAIALIFLGAEHFWSVAYVSGRIPDWMPARIVWDWLVGALIMAGGLGLALVKGRVLYRIGLGLGIMLVLLAAIYHIPVLIAEPRNGGQWTAALLDCMIASGGWILAARVTDPGRYEAGSVWSVSNLL